MKLTVAILFAAFSVTTLPAQAQETIKIATEASYAPWAFTNSAGKLDGFEIEFVNALCTRIKAQCQIANQSWDGLIPSLNAGKYDAIVASMGITPKRLDVIDFSAAYAEAPNTFLVLKGSPADGLASTGIDMPVEAEKEKADESIETLNKQLDGKIIGVQSSTTAAAFLNSRFPGAEVREYKTMDDANMDLASGRIDALLGNITVLQSSMKRDDMKDARLTGPLFRGKIFGEVGIGLRKGDNSLKAQLDSGIESLSRDGTLKKLSMKWFGLDITPSEAK
ncbi:lysine/arginine/ornithine ABC transporter substrate-binding protein [Pantoea sp. YR343]|uniref:lysine/arginine/ornithine ABC transporter substrate-binding protein n=1 Tax=Pantoea sp. YR343 TaxID=1144341 RepID=UPI0002711506|nr:lysine/arginine/ornithine ABC transporter substrate-binding protein [Pantoea sp. YR343]KAJ9431816.1 lysine/arginine/ornithine ABC transporter substrate-binding protein [Pantoea sp. YR343]